LRISGSIVKSALWYSEACGPLKRSGFEVELTGVAVFVENISILKNREQRGRGVTPQIDFFHVFEMVFRFLSHSFL
jgi:hypothetical protein